MTPVLAIALSLCWAAVPTLPVHAGEVVAPWYGADDTCGCSGNGGLTVSVNEYGRVTACMWPSPSFFSQLRMAEQPPQGPGLVAEDAPNPMWGFRPGDKTFWFDERSWRVSTHNLGPAANVAETLLTLGDTGVIARQKLFVCPDKDILVTNLQLYGAKAPFRVYWHASFGPRTRLIPEAPIADWLAGDTGGFAVFVDSGTGTVFHFRPQSPGRKEWEHARRLAENRASVSEWSSFSDGVWIGYRSLEPTSGFQCGVVNDATSALGQADAGMLSGSSSAVGRCDSVLEWEGVPPDPKEYSITLLVSFGKNFAQVRDALDAAAKVGFDQLLREHQQYWTDWFARGQVSSTVPADISEARKRSLLVLVNAMDRNTGAVVHAPSSRPGMALDWAKDGAWITMALDAAGYQDLAERHSLFYRDALRVKSTPGKPAGSLPAASYANHVDGTPHIVLDVDASAWMLWSFWDHASRLAEAARLPYLKKVWEATDLAGDFIAGWVDDRSGEPLPSFSAEHWRDERSDGQLVSMLAGMGAATHIAQALGYERANWNERVRLLKSSAQYHFLDVGQKWKAPEPLSCWQADLVPLDDSRWDEPITEALKSLPKLEGAHAAGMLCDLVSVCKHRTEWLDRVRPLAPAALKRALFGSKTSPAYPDSLTAAKCLVAIAGLYGE